MRMLRIAVLSALLLVLAGTPVSAIPVTYTWLSCASSTGAIAGLSRDPASGYYGVEHSITPCGTPSPNNVYGVVFYHSDGTYWGRPVVFSAGPATGTAEPLVIAANTVAVCLITRPAYRIACASVIVDSFGNATLGPVLPVNAPIVSVTATFPPMVMNAPQPPICPSCMT